jgi:hypothetical protein
MGNLCLAVVGTTTFVISVKTGIQDFKIYNFSLSLKMKHIDTLEFHKNNPDVSVETYVKRKRVDLAHEISFSKKIYLDLKFWILLRDARIKKVDSNILELLNIIENLVKQGNTICPISCDIFTEMLKQDDVKTLKATAQIIDEFSKGITILSLPERLDFELFHFIRSKLNQEVYEPNEMVWTKIAYVMGFVTPTSEVFSPELNCAMQKAFVDQMWVIPLTDMLDFINEKTISSKPPFIDIDISKQLNEGKVAHINEHSSFKQMFLAELAGMLDLCKPNFQSLMVHLYESEIGRKVSADEISSDNAGQMFANLIYNAFRFNKITTEFPSFHVMAKIHEATRWDKNRIIKPNDIYDIHHAIDAIPYYDYFLTEHSLKHLVSNKNLGFDVFHCKTISDIDSAISELSQISSIK